MDILSLNRKVIIPQNVNIEFKNNIYYITGPKGCVEHNLNESLQIDLFKDHLLIMLKKEKSLKKKSLIKFKSLINTTFSLFNSYIFGVLNFFSRSLIFKGIGYKVEKNNSALVLSIGYSHPVEMQVPKNIFIDIIDPINITLKSVSKQAVTQFALKIKEKRLPEIYKGNGIRYKEERIKLKMPKKSK